MGPAYFVYASQGYIDQQLKDMNAKFLQTNSAPVWLIPAKGSATMAAAEESVYADPADSGITSRSDAITYQYSYNWGSPKNRGGYYWRVGGKLDGGRRYAVNIGLR